MDDASANIGINPEPLLSPEQLANKLNMSLKWVEKHTQERRIPGQVKVGRVWRYNWIEVQKRMISGQVLLDPIRRKGHH
jgi:predicted DNA-binding transcriptional regulator AlpA